MRTKGEYMSQAEYNLGKHCGITFAKLKPASLYTIKEDEREIFIHFLEKFRAKGFEYKFMRVAKGRFLVYVYNRSCLEKILFDERNRRFLQERGYNYKTLTQSVELMRERLQEEDFPHEIGVFLGYPLEDVRGFIEKPTARTGLCGYWKVYSNECEKQKIFDRFRKCTNCICNKMIAGQSITKIFQVE